MGVIYVKVLWKASSVPQINSIIIIAYHPYKSTSIAALGPEKSLTTFLFYFVVSH